MDVTLATAGLNMNDLCTDGLLRDDIEMSVCVLRMYWLITSLFACDAKHVVVA